jgi:hypothetical protein
MKILFDQGTPVPFLEFRVEHDDHDAIVYYLFDFSTSLKDHSLLRSAQKDHFVPHLERFGHVTPT